MSDIQRAVRNIMDNRPPGYWSDDIYVVCEAAKKYDKAIPMVVMGGLSQAWYRQQADDTDPPDGWLIVNE